MTLRTLGDELIFHILLALAILGVTVICGLPLLRSAGTRSLTRIALSFALGYVLLSTAGIAGALVGIDPIVPQVCTALAGAFLSLSGTAQASPCCSAPAYCWRPACNRFSPCSISHPRPRLLRNRL